MGRATNKGTEDDVNPSVGNAIKQGVERRLIALQERRQLAWTRKSALVDAAFYF